MGANIEKVIRMVYTTGRGVEGDPVRTVVEYWTQDGYKIAEFDINDDPVWRHHLQQAGNGMAT